MTANIKKEIANVVSKNTLNQPVVGALTPDKK